MQPDYISPRLISGPNLSPIRTLLRKFCIETKILLSEQSEQSFDEISEPADELNSCDSERLTLIMMPSSQSCDLSLSDNISENDSDDCELQKVHP